MSSSTVATNTNLEKHDRLFEIEQLLRNIVVVYIEDEKPKQTSLIK